MPKGKWPDRSWILLLAGVILVRSSTLEPQWVEQYYSSGIYPYIARFFRALTSWIPFSAGDLLYVAAIIWLIRELAGWVKMIRKHALDRPWLLNRISNYTRIFLCIYLVFNILWGLNYNRTGIAGQLGLALEDSSSTELSRLTEALILKTNQMRPSDPDIGFGRSSELARQAYISGSSKYPFLDPRPFSLKPSIFGAIGNYMGYSGYYNPLTGEGQVNTKVPGFLIPFVACHEMAHQAGYARENEANFVGFLAARESKDSALLYSTYLNMFLYANGELRQIDSVAAKNNMARLTPGVKKDIDHYRKWLRSYDTVVGDLVDIFYNQYLKLNEQPAGRRSYNQVVTWLLAYRRKYRQI
jgi:Protein of unknown function (DUF3810)